MSKIPLVKILCYKQYKSYSAYQISLEHKLSMVYICKLKDDRVKDRMSKKCLHNGLSINVNIVFTEPAIAKSF